MNGQTIRTAAREGPLVKRAGRTIATIICTAFMLDCLADEAWPGPAQSR